MADKVRTISLYFSIFFLAVCTSGCAVNPVGESPASPLIREGEKLLDEGQYREAIQTFRRAVGIEPQNAFAYRGLGIAYYNYGDHYRAEIFMRKALQLNKRMSDLWGYLGDIYMQKGDEEKAISFFEKCPPEDPHYAELHFRLGKIRLQSNDINAADIEFTRALTHDDFWGGYWGKGRIAQLKGDWNEALNWYRQAYNRAQKPEVLLGLAEAYDKLGHKTPAFFFYTLFIGTDPAEDTAEYVHKRLEELENDMQFSVDSIERKIQFEVKNQSDVSAGICARNGKIIKMLFSGMLSKGDYHLEWDGNDEGGKPVEKGEYIGFVLIGDECKLHKFIVR